MRYKPSNIQSNNLFSMMQTGGRVSRGRTAVRRVMQRQFDQAQLEKAQRAEARRQKRGGLLGSIGGLAGGLLGSALVATTGPLGLALATGLGTAGGSLLGQKLGYGKGRTKVDRKGTVYAQDAFSDVSRAGSDYRSGMGERALQSGIKAGLQAGVAGVGKGLYGKFAGKLRKAPTDVVSSVGDVVSDSGSILGTVAAYQQSLPKALALGQKNLIPPGAGGTTPNLLSRAIDPIIDTSAPLAYTPTIVTPTNAQGVRVGVPTYQDGGFVSSLGYDENNPMAIRSDSEMDAGGFAYSGGFDKSSLLGDEYNLTPAQLRLIADADTSPITEMATQSRQALRNLSSQPAMATAQTGLGLGAATYQTGQQRQDIQEGFETGVEKFREDVKSDLEGQVAELIAGGADIGMKGEGGIAEYATVPSTLQISTQNASMPGLNAPSFEITVGGEPHYWSAKMNRYIGKDLWNTMIMGPGGGPNFHGSMQSFQDSQTGQIA